MFPVFFQNGATLFLKKCYFNLSFLLIMMNQNELFLLKLRELK